MKIHFIIILTLLFSSVYLFGQHPIKTETLSWCKCDPNTISNPELRQTSACERIFYDTIVKQIMRALDKATTRIGVNGFFVDEILPGEGVKIEYIGTFQSSLPFNVGDMGTPIPAPAIKWICNGDSAYSKVLYHKIDSLALILSNSTLNGSWSIGLNDQISSQIFELHNLAYVTLTIYTNRHFEQKVYGSKHPYILTSTSTNQVIRIPFSMDSKENKSTGLKGTTTNQTILLYGAYKPVQIIRSDEDQSYSIKIESNILHGKPVLNLYGVELRFEGNQNMIDQIIRLIDQQGIENAILRY